MIEAPAEYSGENDEGWIIRLLDALERKLSVGKILIDRVLLDGDVMSARPIDGITPRGIEIADQKLGNDLCLTASIDAMVDAPNAVDVRRAIEEPLERRRSPAGDEQQFFFRRRRKNF